MPFPKPPFHSGHQTNEALSHETVRKYHRHNPPTPLEKHRINPPTPQFNSWGSDVQYTTRKKRDKVPWSEQDVKNACYPMNKQARRVSNDFKKAVVKPGYISDYKKSLEPPHFTMSPLRSHYRRTEYGARSSNETQEPLLRANEASKPWNIVHHHKSKHPDEPEPGGPGLKSQRSSEPYHILHSKPLIKHPDFKKKVLMSTLSPRGGNSEYIFRHSPARRAMDIVTNGFTEKSARDDAINYEKKILINELILDLKLGYYDFEKEKSQKVKFSLEIDYEDKKPSSDKDIKSIVNYGTIVKLITKLVKKKHYNFLETLAEAVFDELFKDKRIAKIMLKIEKLEILKQCSSVGIQITKKRSHDKL